MSIASRITEMETHIGNAYTSIDNLGIDISNTNKNIYNISTLLDTFYESLPKVSGIGASLSLSPSMVGKIKLNEIQGDTFQQTYSGKNMFGGFTFSRTDNGITFTYNKDGSIKANGTSSASASSLTSAVARNNNYLVTLETGTYTISGGNSNATVEVIKSDGSFISGVATSEISKTFTISSTTSAFIRLNVASGKTLNNVIVYQMLEHSSTATDYEPYVGGVPSPNPEYPQEIFSVTGLQNVGIYGKNLFDKDNITSGKRLYYYQGTANLIDDANYCVSDYINVNENTTYTINLTMSAYTRMIFYDNNKSPLSANETNATFTTPNNTAYVRLSVPLNQLDTTQLENNSTATTYEPYKGNTYEVNLGKNLFDINGTFSTGLIKYNNGFQLIKNSTNRTTNYFPASPILAGTYTLSYDIVSSTLSSINKAYVQFFDKDNTKISDGTLSSNGSTTFTFTGDAVKIYFFISSNESADVQITLDNIQLEKGSTATSYAPYFTPIELNEIGDYEDYIFKNEPSSPLYDDTLTLNSWYITKNIGEKIVEDNSGWGKSSRSDVNRYYIYNYLSGGLEKKDISTLVCNYVNCISQNQADAGNLGLANLNGNGLMVQFALSDTDFDTLQKWKTFVGTYKPKVLYVLATPTYEVITNTTLIEQLETLRKAKSKNGTTNIVITSNDLSMLMDVSVIKGE